MFPSLRAVLKWLWLLPSLSLLLVLGAPWVARVVPGFRVPGSDRTVLAHLLSFPFLLALGLGAFFLLWTAAAGARHLVSRRRASRSSTKNDQKNGHEQDEPSGAGGAPAASASTGSTGAGGRAPWRSLGGRLLVPGTGLLVTVLAAAAGTGLGLVQPEQPEGQGRELDVVSWNTHDELTSAQLSDLVAADPGVVVLPETTEEVVAEHLEALGRTEQYQLFHSDAPRGVAPTSVLVSRELGAYQEASGARTTLGTVSVEPVDASSDSPAVLAVHTASPTRGWMQRWRQDLEDVLEAACPASGREDRQEEEGSGGSEGAVARPVIAAGDFNATPWHGRMASLPSTGCADAAASTGLRAGTWPSFVPAWARTPIDHVLVDGARPVASSIPEVGGTSDHLPVATTLRW